MAYEASFRVWRGDDTDGKLENFSVEVNEGEVVLDIIHRLQATQAPDLAVRWNCKAGKCGSCSAEVNGKPRLMCMTRMSTFSPAETITVTPMRTFPIIKDLVTDVSFNYQKAREVPSFTPPVDLQPGDYRMAQVDVERSQEFRKCIECFLCQNVCHVIRDHEQNKPKFSGPRFFIRLAELDMHPLDTLDRRELAQKEAGIGYCNITKCCTEVCPEGIHITDNAIIAMKERVVDLKYDPALRGSRRKSEIVDDSLFQSGRFTEAAAVAQERVNSVRGRGKQRQAAATDLAWSLLCGIEAKQVKDNDDVRRTIDAQMLTATSLAGNVLIAHKAALYHLYLGDDDKAAREVDDVLSWDRPAAERADALLTSARLKHSAGDVTGAQAALGAAAKLSPSNPRLPAVREILGV